MSLEEIVDNGAIMNSAGIMPVSVVGIEALVFGAEGRKRGVARFGNAVNDFFSGKLGFYGC